MFSIDAMLKNDHKAIDNVALSINRKEMEYRCYIVQHRYNIKYMFIKYRDVLESTLDMTDTEMDRLEARIEIHDLSKFADKKEFDQYRLAFYPTDEERSTMELDKSENREQVMHEAWVHHYTFNDHHPEHWIIDDYVSKMPKAAIAEMVLDWLAMQFTSGKPVFEWYKKNEPEMPFHPDTRIVVWRVMNAIKNYNHQIGEDNL